MGSEFTEELWESILARLSLKSITTSKLVCKQWKSIVESPYFHELFRTHHQNSHSSWSLIYRDRPSSEEVVAHYGCEIWGLPRPLGHYISSFLTNKFETPMEILAYTDVGLILITLRSKSSRNPPPYYVANPISQECVKIPPRPLRRLGEQEERYRPGLATRMEKDVLLGYKVVLMDTSNIVTAGVLSLLVYSSETGLWSYNTLHSHPELHLMTYTRNLIDAEFYISLMKGETRCYQEVAQFLKDFSCI